jgi:hypothetical protein
MLCKSRYSMRERCAALRSLLWVCAAVPLIAPAADADSSYEEWSAETRTSLGFRVNAAAVSALLPNGWTVSDASGKVSLSLTFMDRHMVMDPQGNPVGSGVSRYMVMSVQARNTVSGESSLMIINGVSPEGAGAYEVYQTATLASASRLVSGQGEATGQVEEHWHMSAQSGDSVQLTLRYQPALPLRRQSSIVIRSGKNTQYTRTYRIDQASDPLGVPGARDSRLQSYEFTAQGPLFSVLFDGSEELTGITSTPWYNREIYIP